MAANKLSLKLVIDKKSNRVLFAEAGKDVVDFLFSLLSLPIGSAVKLLTKAKMMGSFGNLYESVENLDATLINNKDLLLSPKVAASPLNVPVLIQNDEATITVYKCSLHPHYGLFSTNPTTTCPMCTYSSQYMSTATAYTPPNMVGKGYVKEQVLYMVKDNLTVMVMSSTAIIALLAVFGIDNVKSLEEKVVDLGMDEGLELLRTSWQSQNVLSQVFLTKKEK
ncbi:hypothetical protein AQUCO_02700247v1 [Aquilegia coerulea]|uniref:DUF674 domain-containing protein n=1 Tax=Aquilegia coerulea TaxID=218851 RepID=A0A2G5D5X6_AQUCA|nr:hypothetical protein AQUCO_02700247v1 [Aquilegia coerulea]